MYFTQYSSISKIIITENDYPELLLEPKEIASFNELDPEQQEDTLGEWMQMRPFLRQFPMTTLPADLFILENEHPKIVCFYGWTTSYEDLWELALKRFPEAVRRALDGRPSPVATSVHVTENLAGVCHLPMLKLELGWAGVGRSNCLPVLSISSNYESDEERKNISTEGIEQLKSIVPNLSENPVWVVDYENDFWPSAVSN